MKKTKNSKKAKTPEKIPTTKMELALRECDGKHAVIQIRVTPELKAEWIEFLEKTDANGSKLLREAMKREIRLGEIA